MYRHSVVLRDDGDNAKAEDLFRQALAINPDGVDANDFFADFLYSRNRYADALRYLERALNAPARPGRDVADAGVRDEVRALMKKVKSRMAGDSRAEN